MQRFSRCSPLIPRGTLKLFMPKWIHPGKDAIAIETRTNNPYGNVIAVRARDRDKPVFKTLVAAYHSDEIRQFILTQFDGAILPVF
jgi:D-methionine transport system substrate-binding protein